MSTPTEAPFKVSRERNVTMPLALLAAIIGAVAIGYAALNSTRDQVQRNSTDISDLKSDARTTREILIRIDENVKDLRRSQRKGDSP